MHYCGEAKPAPKATPAAVAETENFPTLRPLLRGVHCELHICVLERNGAPPTLHLPREALRVPDGALATRLQH